MQKEDETLYEAWKCFKELLRKCPNHALTNWQQVQIFYSGMNPTTKFMVDASTSGSLNTKTLKQARELIETMAVNEYQMPSERRIGVLHVVPQMPFWPRASS